MPPADQAATDYRRQAVWSAGGLLAAGLLSTGGAYTLFFNVSAPPGGLSVIAALAAFCLAAAISLGLAWANHPTAAGVVLIAALALLFPGLTALLTDVGGLLGVTLGGLAAAVAGLTLAYWPARRAVLAGLAAVVLTLLLDIFAEQLLPWPRLTLPAVVRDVYLPLLAGGLLTGLGGLALRHFPRYRLSTKLLISFLGVALAPLALVSAWNDQASSAALRAAAQQSLLTAASQTAAALDAFVDAHLSTVTTAGRLPALSQYLRQPADTRANSPSERQVRDLLAALPAPILPNLSAPTETPAFQAYALLDEQGRPALSTLAEWPGAGEWIATLAAEVQTNRRAAVSPVLYSSAGQGRLYFAAPVLDEAETFQGVLVGEVDAVWLQRLLTPNPAAQPEAAGLVTAIFDDHGLRLADSAAAGTNALRLAAAPEAAIVAAWQAAGRVPAWPAADLDAGLPVLAAEVQAALDDHTPRAFTGAVYFTRDPARPTPDHLAVLLPLASRPWVVLTAQPESVALAPARAQTRANLLFGLAVGVVVAGLSALAARSLARPIRRLTQAAQRVRAGDLSVRPWPLAADEIGQLTETFNTMTTRLQQTVAELEQRVAARTAQLQAAADIGRATAGIRDLNELLGLAVELVPARFGHYHASIFLLDEAGDYAVLAAASGETGAQLTAHGYRLAVGSRSLVGWVTQHREPRHARAATADPFYLHNPALPETRSELCLPLAVGGRLLGALDVQSRTTEAFSAADVQALQVLADQLSIAIENAQLLRAAQADLAEARALYTRTLAANWRLAIGTRPRELVYELEPGAGEGDTADPVRLPLRLRDRAIGVIEFYGRPAALPLSAEEAAVLETVGAQLATALENAALIQESQARSRRDQLITTITDEIRATLNPAVILQTGIRQLGRALGDAEVTVRLQPPAREARTRGRDAG